ncbi:MAG: phosphoglucomutase/phosphomannomutase family protein [Eubacteriales bacterium]
MIKFGTGGWRAIIGDEFTKENLCILCTAVARMMQDENKADKFIVIGYDRRFLSKESAEWAAEVFAGNGIASKVIDREAPTPLIMFTVKTMELHYGMAITASHNPALYNGVKLFTAGGRDANEVVTANLEKYIAQVTAADIKRLAYPKAIACGLIEEFNPQNEYIDSILGLVDVDKIKAARLKIALDPMFGVSQTSIRTILAATRSELEVIHERHDTLFGGRLPAPNEDTLGSLSRFVIENKCDMGVATDGDADRIGVIDEFGGFINPNQLLVLLYYYLLKYRGWKGPVVRNNSTTHLLDRVAKSFGETCYEVPVGFKHISSKLEETGAIIGGESSGGLTVKGHILGKDGIYAVALLAEIIAVTGMKLSELYREITEIYGDCYLGDASFHLADNDEKTMLMDKIYSDKIIPEFPFEVDRISYLDGCKVYFNNGGWVIARFSGTEPLLRIASEMATKEAADAVVKLFSDALEL